MTPTHFRLLSFSNAQCVAVMSNALGAANFLVGCKAFQDRVLRGPALLLARLGVTPAAVSIAGVFAMCVASFVMRSAPYTAVMFIFASVLADALDGTLARITKGDSSTGRVFDVVTDNASFIIFLLGLTAAGLVDITRSALLGAVIVFSATVNTFRAFRAAHRAGVSAGATRGYWFFPNLAKFTLYLLFIASVFGTPPLINDAAPILAVVTFCEIAYRFIPRTYA